MDNWARLKKRNFEEPGKHHQTRAAHLIYFAFIALLVHVAGFDVFTLFFEPRPTAQRMCLAIDDMWHRVHRVA